MNNLTAEWTGVSRNAWSWRSQVSRTWGETANRRKVLIIDDDPGLSRMAALILRGESFEVDIANSGEDGLACLDSTVYDAIVLDLRMPGKDGRTVFRELRAAGVQTPVLILSAYDARRAGEELGSQSFLDKPFEPDLLVERVNQMLNGDRR